MRISRDTFFLLDLPMKLIRVPLFAVLSLLAAPLLNAAEPLDRIVAVVNDGIVLQSELDRAIHITEGQLRERGITPPPESALKSQVLEQQILRRLQTQRATEAGIRVDDRELNEVLGNIAAQNKMTVAQFADALKKDGIDYQSVREQVRDEVLSQRVRQKEVGARIVVTEQDVDLALANTTIEDTTEYRLSHILIAIPDGAGTEAREAARAKAGKVLKELRAGGDFAQLAIANSDGQQALQGGDLDWRKGGNLPTAFVNVAPKLAIGQFSDLIETGNGYNIIKLADKRDGGERLTVNETRASHILVTPNAIRDEEATRALARDLRDRIAKGEDFAALAKKYSDDPGSKNGGGDLSWQPPGVFAPEFQTAIDALAINEVSAPFHTQFGWHVAKVVERRTRDATVEARRGRIRQSIQQRKENEEYESWLRRLRAEAYVEYRMNPDSAAAPAAKPAG
ncbi:MAG: peptidylprolyl isomerase [Nevskia sp.]